MYIAPVNFWPIFWLAFSRYSGKYYVVIFRVYQCCLFNVFLLSGVKKWFRFKALGLCRVGVWTIYLANVLYEKTYEGI